MKRVKLFEEFLNELEFKDKADYAEYLKTHNVRKGTKITFVKDKAETEESSGTIGFVKPNSMDKDKPYLYVRYKDTIYAFRDGNGWSEAFMNDNSKKELEDFKVPFAQPIKVGETRLADSADKFLKELGLKEEDPKEVEKKEAIKNQIEEFDEDKDYPKVKSSAADDKAFKELAKDEEMQDFLGYLVHDKSHVMDNDEEVPEMTKVFKATEDVEFKGSLFRGMYSANPKDFKVGETKSFGRYQSFSESPGVAKGFSGTKEGQGVVLKVDNPKGGLNYAAWLEKNMDQGDEDNTEVMKTSRYEKEHVFDRNQKYKVTKIEDSKPFTIVHIQFI